jgi:hypothetical protein
MLSGFGAEYAGEAPFYEVWYGKVDVADEVALWFRYTTLDGVIREASTWAVVFDGEEAFGDRTFWEIEDLAPRNTVRVPEGYDPDRFLGSEQVFHVEDSHLDTSNAIGRAGDIEWDFQWEDSGRRCEYVPELLQGLSAVKSAYDSTFLDVRASGTLEYEGRERTFERAPAMLGHIRGTKISGHHWAWAHCNHFDGDEDVAFEGLSVSLEALGTHTPPLSAFFVYVDDRRYSFRTPLSIVRAETTFDRDHWTFRARSGGAELIGEATAPSNVALVQYDDTDGSNLWCYNSKLADLEFRLRDPEHGLDQSWTATGTSAFEYVTREEPDETPLI